MRPGAGNALSVSRGPLLERPLLGGASPVPPGDTGEPPAPAAATPSHRLCIDAAYVHARLAELVKDKDTAGYIL
jgi:hypothetical protein